MFPCWEVWWIPFYLSMPPSTLIHPPSPPIKVAPQSRGTVTLASADPSALPIINPNWLISPTDQTLAIEVYRKIRRIFNTPAFKAIRVNNEEYFPGMRDFSSAIRAQSLMIVRTGLDASSDSEILAVIEGSLMTVRLPPFTFNSVFTYFYLLLAALARGMHLCHAAS